MQHHFLNLSLHSQCCRSKSIILSWGFSYMGPDNLPILETVRVKNMQALQFWAHAEASHSGGSRVVSIKYYSSPPMCWEKGEASRLGWLVMSCCQLKGAAAFMLLTSTTSL